MGMADRFQALEREFSWIMTQYYDNLLLNATSEGEKSSVRKSLQKLWKLHYKSEDWLPTTVLASSHSQTDRGLPVAWEKL